MTARQEGRVSPSAIIDLAFESRALQGNPLGDPARRSLPVYLPPGYSDSAQHFAVVYLLAAYANTGPGMMNFRPWEENIQQRMDRLIAEEVVRPMILVMPDCFTRYGGSQYLNSSATGRYQDYLLEIVDHVDAQLRSVPQRSHRALAGHSSGGYGALYTAAHNPKLFSMVADQSGDKYFDLCYRSDLGNFLRALQQIASLEALLRSPESIRPKGSSFFSVMSMAAMSACYSPNPEAALGFDLPVDPFTGEFDAEVWSRWLAFDPVERVAEWESGLRALNLLYFDCGKHDEYNLQFGSRLFAARLKTRGINFVYEEFDDGHRSISYRYDRSLQAISETIGAATQGATDV